MVMVAQWQLSIKKSFLDDLDKLSPKEHRQLRAKLDMLEQDPLPDGDIKKHLTHLPGKPYRIRSGDFRILYTYNKSWIIVYKLERKKEDTYKKNLSAGPVELEGLDIEFDDVIAVQAPHDHWEWYSVKDESRPLPEPITIDLLNKLHIPQEYHTRLLRIKTQDELLRCPGIDDGVLLKINDFMFELPLIQVMQQPDLVLNDVDDLLRYKEGELLGFLLKLSPEQERYVSWSMRATGPTLVKGGPGTGKSTGALYRIRLMLEQLTRAGKGAQRLLFTTYTTPLIKSSKRLLQHLPGSMHHQM